eukprot:m.308966 g.308966  ORF g.308966 m.308966 type:complete len:474 (+) comp45190_c0_seq1:28-1449(+)
MSSHNDFVRDELKRLRYNYQDQTKRDVMTVLANFKDLAPKSDIFVSNQGERKNRLSLNGTIPVTYKGATYNIPVRIWLRLDHPYTSPIPYVIPTESMSIKESRHVDQTGMVYLPYLHEWNDRRCDLSGLIQVMSVIFSEQPPVFAKPVNQRRPPPLSSSNPRPPYPQSQQYRPPYGGPQPSHPNLPGGYPPYPSGGPQYGTPYGNSPYPPASRQPGPGGFMPMPKVQPVPAPSPGGPPPSRSAPYPTQSQPSQPSHMPYPSSGPKAGPVVSPVALATAQGSFDPAPPQKTSQRPSGAERQSSYELTPEEQRACLLSSIEDKLRRQLKVTWETAENEMQSLHQTKVELEQGSRKLNGMLTTLDEKQKEVEANIQMLTTKDEEIREALVKLESSSKNLDVETVVVAAAPLYNQIFKLYAEENAVEDTIYYLTEGLRKGVIEVDAYLKHVRGLSRTQFEKRTLMQKARAKAGLGEL